MSFWSPGSISSARIKGEWEVWGRDPAGWSDGIGDGMVAWKKEQKVPSVSPGKARVMLKLS